MESFSSYWGWGGEDDDVYERCKYRRLDPKQLDLKIGKFKVKFQWSIFTHLDHLKNPGRDWKGISYEDTVCHFPYLKWKIYSVTKKFHNFFKFVIKVIRQFVFHNLSQFICHLKLIEMIDISFERLSVDVAR